MTEFIRVVIMSLFGGGAVICLIAGIVSLIKADWFSVVLSFGLALVFSLLVYATKKAFED